MIVVAYKDIDRAGVVHLPFKELPYAKLVADKFIKQGRIDVKVLRVTEEILYTPISGTK